MDKDDKKRIIELLMKLISIKSFSGIEDEVSSFIKKKLSEMGVSFFEEKGNLYAIKGNPQLLIATHMDTVPGWRHPDAFSPRFDGKRIWGRGAADTKGQIASLLSAMERGKNFFVAFFRDEEEGGTGSEEFSVPEGIRIKGAVVLEPTSLTVAISQAGSLEIEITAEGKSSHGATPRCGKNAAEVFFRIFQKLKDTFIYEDPLFPYSGINLARINAGIDPQLVPDLCIARLDIPVLPDMDLEDSVRKIKEVVEEEGAEFRITEKSYPWKISEKEWIVEKVKDAYRRALGKEPEISGMPAWTDATNLMEKGIPCVIFGAGDLCCAHTPYENVDSDELYKLFLVIEKLME